MICPKRSIKSSRFPSDSARSRIRLMETPKFEIAFGKINENSSSAKSGTHALEPKVTPVLSFSVYPEKLFIVFFIFYANS